MARRVHFFDEDKGRVACGVAEPKPYRRGTKSTRYCKSLKSTTDYAAVTCNRCKEIAAKKILYFICPQCGQRSEKFTLIESVLEKSSVYAYDKSKRVEKKSLKRELVSIVCPICNKESPATEDWRKTSIKLRV